MIINSILLNKKFDKIANGSEVKQSCKLPL